VSHALPGLARTRLILLAVWCPAHCPGYRGGFLPTKFKENNIMESGGAYRAPISLACQGAIVIRRVFKLSKLSWPSPKYCGYTHIYSTKENAQVVRCELELPTGPGSEDARAVTAKEGKCYICDDCDKGGGCPGKVSGRGHVEMRASYNEHNCCQAFLLLPQWLYPDLMLASAGGSVVCRHRN